MKRIFVPTRDGSDWQRLLAKPELHWKPGASAMTTAAAWEDANDRLPPEIRSSLTSTGLPALQDLSLLAAIPEWEVALPGGNTTSHTDVLALCRNEAGLCVVAVEAKVLEDFGPLVGEKRQQASDNQRLRLAYLHQLLKVDHFDDSIRYQLLHRTASALLTATDFHATTAIMLIQAFSTPAERQQDFIAFCAAMRAEQITDRVFRVQGFDRPALYLAWCDGNADFREVQLPNTIS